MPRPPLANLFAVHDPDPHALHETMLALQQGGEFALVWCPAPGWVAAVAPLPDSSLDDEPVRQEQLAFAEGRDVVLDESGQDAAARVREIVELADRQPERLASLPGDFGFIRFRAGGEATVVRSCGGLVPFYLKQSGRCWAIATRLGDMVRYLPDEPRLDPLVNAIWAASWGMFPDGRTFLEGVRILERGHFARLGEQLQVGRYWNPRPKRAVRPTPAQAREHAQRLRALLIAKLERDLDPEGGNLLTLSGGVDSSSLGALAAGVAGRQVWTWSVLPSKENAEFLREAMSFIDPLAQQFGFARRWETHFHERLVLELYPAAPRIVFHVIHPALCSLPQVAREAPVRVLFGGESADEVCGSAFTVADWGRDTSLLQLLFDPSLALKNPRLIVRWSRLRLSSWRGREMFPIPEELLEMDIKGEERLEFFHPEVQAQYLAWWKRKRNEWRHDTGPWRYLSMHLAVHDGYVPMNWEACSALGIRRSLPFFNREALELMFECHPTELYGPGTKKLLRAALHDDVPSKNLYREDKGGWGIGERKLNSSWQEPTPYPSLPEELEPVLSPELFANPPASGVASGRCPPFSRIHRPEENMVDTCYRRAVWSYNVCAGRSAVFVTRKENANANTAAQRQADEPGPAEAALRSAHADQVGHRAATHRWCGWRTKP